MNIKERIDKRIKTLEAAYKESVKEKDVQMTNQTWARLNELKNLKKEFTYSDNNWGKIE